MSREFRAPKKKKFQLEYATVINVLEELTDVEIGEFFKAVAEYELYGDEPKDFSDRTVRSIFRTTQRELDYQLEKHYARIEQGTLNQKGGKQAYTELLDVLSVNDLDELENKYVCCEMLIKEIQEQLKENGTVVQYPKRYIEKYAEESNWNQRIESEINDIAMGIKPNQR